MIFLQEILFLLVLLIFIGYTEQQVNDPEFMEKWNKAREECSVQEGINLATATKLWADNSFPEDNKLKCYYKCTTTKLGIMDQTGEVVDDALGYVSSHFNDRSTKEEIVAECGPLKGTDLCDTAYKLMKCIKAAKLD